jgi:RHS repeat-associated protein
MTASPALHAQTPNLAVIDSRGLPIRTVAYLRQKVDEPAQARITRQKHDAFGRMVFQWDPRLWMNAEKNASVSANQATSYSLSGRGLGITSVDAGWRLKVLNAAGEASHCLDSRGSETRLTYDYQLRPVEIFERGRGENERCVERLTYAGNETAEHNLCGQLIRHDDPAGSQRIHERGVTGGILRKSRRFLQQETVSDWPMAESQCDGSLESGEGAVSQQQLDALGEPITHTDAKGHRQRFAYTMSGQLQSVCLQLLDQAEHELLSAIRYNAFGHIEQKIAGNGIVTTALHSSIDGRLDRLISRKAEGAWLQDLIYGYDAAGNIVSIQDNAQPAGYFDNQRIQAINTYGYNTLSELIIATGRESVAKAQRPGQPRLKPMIVNCFQLANYTRSYDYDAGGNLISLRHVGATTFTREMQVAIDSNRSIVKNEGDLTTGFDLNGNLLQLQRGTGLTWDLRNQLSQITPVERNHADDDYERYVYDAEGQRVRKVRRSKAGNLTHIAEVRYLPNLEIRTNTATGETLHVVTIAAGSSSIRVLHWETGLPEGLVNNQIRYNLCDHLGSSSLELDQHTLLISREEYYPFGETAWWLGRNATEASYKSIRYSGKERDATGLYYYGFRYYAPWLNRWINPDPSGTIDGLNLYAFVANRPINRVDIDGRIGSDDEPAKKKPKTVNLPFRNAGGTSSFSDLFSDIPAAGGQAAGRSTTPVQKDEMFGGSFFRALLRNAPGDEEVRRLSTLFSAPLGISLNTVYSTGLDAKREDSAPHAANLLNEEYLALRFYLSPSFYKKINTYLRQDHWASQDKKMEAVTTLIVSALGKLDSPASKKSFRATVNWSYPEGRNYIEKGMFSTSADVRRTHQFAQFAHNIGEGSQKTTAIVFGTSGRRVGSGITEIGTPLQEVIYPPNTQFDIFFRATSSSGTNLVVMEETGSSGSIKRQVDALTLAPLSTFYPARSARWGL